MDGLLDRAVEPARLPVPAGVRRAWLAVGGVACFLLAAIVCNAWMLSPGDPGHVRGADLGKDYLGFYTGAAFAADGRVASLYDLHAVRAFQQGFSTQQQVDLGGAFLPWWYPPFTATLLAPLARLPYFAGLGTWEALNALAAIAAAILLARQLPARWRGDARVWPVLPAAILLCPPFLLAAVHGQNSGVSLLLATVIVTNWIGHDDPAGRRRANPLLAGVVCGMLFYKPQLAAVLAIGLVARRGRRAAIGVAGTIGAMLLATVCLLPGALSAWLTYMPANLRTFQNDPSYTWDRHATFNAFWRLAIQGTAGGTTQPIVTVLAVLCGIAMAAIVFLALQRVRDEQAAAAIVLTAMPLLVPFYFDYDLLLLTIPATLLASIRLGQPSRSIDRWTTRAWIALVACLPFATHIADLTHINLIVPLLAVAATLTARSLACSRAAAANRSVIAPRWSLRQLPPFRRALWLAGGLAAVCIGSALIGNALLPSDKAVSLESLGHDFLPSYAAGRLVVQGRATSMYDLDAVRATEWSASPAVMRQASEGDAAIAAAANTNTPAPPKVGAWLNPPFFALLFAPLAMLSYPAAAGLWFGLNAIALLIGVGLLGHLLPRNVPPSARWLLPLLLVVSFPCLQAMVHQQNTFLSLAIVGAATAFWVRPARTPFVERRRRAVVGGLCALLMFKPQIGALFALAAIASLGMPAFIGFAAAAAMLFLATIVLLPGTLSAYVGELPRVLAMIQGRPDYAWHRQATFLGLVRAWHRPQGLLPADDAHTIAMIAQATSFLALALAGGFAVRREGREALRSRRWLAAVITTMPLLVPYFMDYDLLVLAVAATLFAGDVWASGGRMTRLDRAAAAAWGAFGIGLYFNTASAAVAGVALNVPMLAIASAAMCFRVVERRPAAPIMPTLHVDKSPPAPWQPRLAA